MRFLTKVPNYPSTTFFPSESKTKFLGKKTCFNKNTKFFVRFSLEGKTCLILIYYPPPPNHPSVHLRGEGGSSCRCILRNFNDSPLLFHMQARQGQTRLQSFTLFFSPARSIYWTFWHRLNVYLHCKYIMHVLEGFAFQMNSYRQWQSSK